MNWLTEMNDHGLDALIRWLRLDRVGSVNYPPGAVEELTLYCVILLLDAALIFYLGRALYRSLDPGAAIPAKKPRWWRGPARGLGIAVGVLAAVELVLRAYIGTQALPTYLPHPLYLWRFQRDADVSVYTPIQPMQFHTNTMGLRDLEIPLEKAPGEFRIVCLGDSATFAQSVELDQSYEKVLERLLTERHPGRKFTVINAGIPGYSILQGFYFFCDVGLRYHPDLVVVNEFNEFSDRQMGEFASNVPIDPVRRAVKTWLWSSEVFLTVRKGVMRFLQPDVPKPGDMNDSEKTILSVDETTYFIRQFISLFQQQHIKGVFALWRRPAAWSPLYAKLLKDVPPSAGLVYEDYHFQLLKRNPAAFWLPNDPSHHPSPRGHAMMAKALLATIEARHLVEDAP